MKHKMIAGLVFAAMLCYFLIPVTTAGAAEKYVFSARDAWYEPEDPAVNTYNGCTEWEWQRKDSGKDWFDFVKYHEARQSFGMKPENVIGSENRTAGAAWTTDGGAWNHPAVGEGWMIPYGQSGKPDNSVCRAFTVPRDGKVTIFTEDGMIYGGSNNPGATNNRTAFVRITKNDEQVWPAEGESVRLPEDSSQAYEFSPISLEVLTGDVLRFEVYNGDEADPGYGKYTWWIPVVSYDYLPSSIEPELRNDVPEDQTFTLTFPDSLEKIAESQISISPQAGGATVKDLSQSSDQTSVSFAFDGLKGGTEYSVTVSGLRIEGGGGEEFSYSFAFTTEEVFEYPVYVSDDAWPDSLTADTMTNSDPVWQFLYKNNLTKDGATPYVPFTLTAQNNTQQYCKPFLNEDGSYDYATQLPESSSEENRTRVYCDDTADARRRNCMGRWWMRLSTATQSEPKWGGNNEIVKAFIAPETGTVRISAEDLAGDAKIYNRVITATNTVGAALKILKKCADGTDVELWSHTLSFTALNYPESGLAEYEFSPLETSLQKGEQLWFVVSGESGGSGYASQVFWNPVVAYTALFPNIVEMSPENGTDGVALNFEQKIKFDYRISPVSLSDIEADGGAAAEEVWLEDDDTTLCLRFSGLQPFTQYHVNLYNIRIFNNNAEDGAVYAIQFTTGAAAQAGEIYLEDGSLRAGSNTVCVDINNAAGSAAPYQAALLAAVCKGTDGDYELVSARQVCRSDIGENDTLRVTVDVADPEQYFIKAVLLERVSTARALLPVKIFQAVKTGGEMQ